MATNVAAIQINFGSQLNSWDAYGEIEVLGNAVAAGNNFLPTTTAVQLGAASGIATLDLSGAQPAGGVFVGLQWLYQRRGDQQRRPGDADPQRHEADRLFSRRDQNGSSSGVLSLAVSGNGTQIFAGANTYSGSTTINGGTLQLGTGAQRPRRVNRRHRRRNEQWGPRLQPLRQPDPQFLCDRRQRQPD